MAFGNHQSLTAAAVATFTLTSTPYTTLELVNRSGAAEVFVTFDQSVPAVGAANTLVLPAQAGLARRFTLAEVNALAGKYANQNGNLIVKVISSGTPTVSVHAW